MKGKVMQKAIFVCLIGIDGSGKTTLGNRLTDLFRKENLDFYYVYGGVQSYLLRPVKFIISRVFLSNQSPFEGYEEYRNKKKELSNRYGILTKLYAAIYWLDFSIQMFFKVSIPLFLGHSIIVDRYVYDTAINLGHNTNISGKPSLKSLEFFLRLFPKPTLLFLIDVEEEIAFARKTDTPAVEYLSERRYLYKQMIESYSGKTIDGTARREDQIEQIRQAVLSILGRVKGEDNP
ncbi:MAG: hypothetical protein JXB42_12280 [Deltaproteobacteria bacterium]|nr:hypothetical protein [Deltaproteobacteria bacterium]